MIEFCLKENKNIKCKFYDTINLFLSDHKPLIGLFKDEFKLNNIKIMII